jgi:type II secretory pathway pseudopilin PulG
VHETEGVANRLARATDAGDGGYTMVALLAVVLILGVLAAIVLGGGLATPQPVATATKGHVVAACKSDFESVSQAVQSYFAANLAFPAPGTAWATASAKGGPYLTAWPTDPAYYTITWSGQDVSVLPAHGSPSCSPLGTTTPKTGCYAS